MSRLTTRQLDALWTVDRDPGLIDFQFATRLSLVKRGLLTNGARGYKLTASGTTEREKIPRSLCRNCRYPVADSEEFCGECLCEDDAE